MVYERRRIGLLQVAIILLTLATAAIHFSLTFPSAMFIANGLGYLVLLAALYLPIPQLAGYRRWVRWILMGYTALTIVLWVAMGSRIPIAYVDKAIEVALLVLLAWESRRAED
jgi:hypothetical protein